MQNDMEGIYREAAGGGSKAFASTCYIDHN
jgi:hypothetical protein